MSLFTVLVAGVVRCLPRGEPTGKKAPDPGGPGPSCGSDPGFVRLVTGEDPNPARHGFADDAAAEVKRRDLAGIDLAGIGLAGIGLAGIGLAGIDLAGIDLAGIDLAGIG